MSIHWRHRSKNAPVNLARLRVTKVRRFQELRTADFGKSSRSRIAKMSSTWNVRGVSKKRMSESCYVYGCVKYWQLRAYIFNSLQYICCMHKQYFVLKEMGGDVEGHGAWYFDRCKIRFYLILVLRFKRYVKLMSKYINSYVDMLDEMENLLNNRY
jgi:hypothetical protein